MTQGQGRSRSLTVVPEVIRDHPIREELTTDVTYDTLILPQILKSDPMFLVGSNFMSPYFGQKFFFSHF